MTLQIDMSNLLSLEPKTQEPLWGPNGKAVYERTYQRTMADGSKESWSDTVRRVVKGNIALVPRDRTFPGEEEALYDLIYNFRAIPGGRHLWMSGVEGRQFLFNCYVSGWEDRLSEHFAFTFNQLMEGGGVGSNYSMKYLDYKIFNPVRVHIVCSDLHGDYSALQDAGLLSTEFDCRSDTSFVVDDSREGWTRALAWVIDIAASPSYEQDTLDLVLDVSQIRKAGMPIKTFGGTSAGPVPFAKMMKDVSHLLNEAYETGFTGPIAMEMDHAIASCVVSGNVRRSARMSIMHWDDPHIFWFLDCKKESWHWSTNISVEIDTEFIDFVNRPSSDGDPRADKARRVYSGIADGMLHNGEPGIWNSDYANQGEPNPVLATNPCGEIALESWENCNLGHINLAAFVTGERILDVAGLVRAHKLMTRFLMRATYGDITDPKTSEVVKRNRRIGLGHTGFADAIYLLGIRYSDVSESTYIRSVLEMLKETVDLEAENYAHQLRIPVPVKKTTVAPTGTISKLPGLNGEGIHPPFAKYYIQRIRFSTVDPEQKAQIDRYYLDGYKILDDPKVPNTQIVEIPMKSTLLAQMERLGYDGSSFQDASEISFTDFLKAQEMYQTIWADNAVSFTINLDPHLFTPEKIMADLRPFLWTLKGTTVFPERGYELAPYERISEATYNALRGNLMDFYGDGVDELCTSGACPVR